MHQCKMTDHKEVCMNKFVTCVNAHYGCEALLARYKKRTHLAHCPASVVHCRFTWERVELVSAVSETGCTPEDYNNGGSIFAKDFLDSDLKRMNKNVGSEYSFTEKIQSYVASHSSSID